jgi:hypothetical protein
MFKTRHKIFGLFGLAIVLGLFVGLQQPSPRPAPSPQDAASAMQRQIDADLDAKAPRVGAFQNWQDCKEKPVSQLSYDELQNCDSLVGWR